MTYGNIVARKGGVLDDPILDPNNPYRKSDLYVRAKVKEGFQGRDTIPFILEFPDGIDSADDLQRIRSFTNQVKRAFGPAVLSLSEIADYRDTGEELLNAPYIPETLRPNFNINEWKRKVANDPTVSGIMVGRDFDWASVVRYLPPKYDDIEEFRATVEFLEDRAVPWWEWLYKSDIEAGEGIGVGGGVITRGLLDQGLNVDTIVLVGLGVVLAFPIFVWSLGSVSQALIGVLGVVLMGFLWARGSIGLLQIFGFDIRERVYTLLAYTNCIVQGVSFVLHKFESFNESAESNAKDPLPKIWNSARTNDHLIGATALIAILGFATLYSFQVLSIRELGVLSAMAVAYQVAFVTLFVPALHIVTSGDKAPRSTPPTAAATFFHKALQGLVDASGKLTTALKPNRTAAIAGATTIALALSATLMIWPGNMLLVLISPLKLVRGTLAEHTGNYLNAENRSGYDLLQLLVEPMDSDADIYDPAFLASASSMQRALTSQTPVREASSILHQVRRVASESLRKENPETRQEARAVFSIIEGDLNTAVARQLFYRRGVQITASLSTNDSSELARAIKEIELVCARFPNLRTSLFGKHSLYPQVDDYIAYGKPYNLFSSQLVVIALCWFGLWLNNRQRWSSRSRGLKLSSFWGGVIMSGPFLFATALMAILMILLGVPLDAATAAISALAINASVDFSIYYADAYQHGLAESGSHQGAIAHAMRTKGRIVLEDMVLNSICFLPLMLSRFEPIQQLGWIMVVMLLACGFGTVVIMPALFYAGLHRRKEEGATPGLS